MNPTDYSILATSLPIAAYGFYQYIKREKEHRTLLQTISHGRISDPQAATPTVKPAFWRLPTLILVEALLIGDYIMRASTMPDIGGGGGKIVGFVVTAYLMLALPGVLGVLKPALWRLMTLCFIEVVLVGAVLWLIYIKSRILYGGEVTYIIAFFFGVLFVVLLPMVVRDIKAYRNK